MVGAAWHDFLAPKFCLWGPGPLAAPGCEREATNHPGVREWEGHPQPPDSGQAVPCAGGHSPQVAQPDNQRLPGISQLAGRSAMRMLPGGAAALLACSVMGGQGGAAAGYCCFSGMSAPSTGRDVCAKYWAQWLGRWQRGGPHQGGSARRRQ
jgi:hypothetical protein